MDACGNQMEKEPPKHQCKICRKKRLYTLHGLKLHCISVHKVRGQRYYELTGDSVLVPKTLGEKLWDLKIRKVRKA